MSKLQIELASRYVLFVALSEDRIAAFLPTLPPLMDQKSHNYNDYLDGFEHAVLGDYAMDPDKYVGEIFIYHVNGIYHFTALTPMLVSCWKKGSILVIPYCPQEGLLDELSYGKNISVMTKNEAFRVDPKAIEDTGAHVENPSLDLTHVSIEELSRVQEMLENDDTDMAIDLSETDGIVSADDDDDDELMKKYKALMDGSD